MAPKQKRGDRDARDKGRSGEGERAVQVGDGKEVEAEEGEGKMRTVGAGRMEDDANIHPRPLDTRTFVTRTETLADPPSPMRALQLSLA